jgi:NADP-dependent 3-hydroxy acid dehydrogenase YdfG
VGALGILESQRVRERIKDGIGGAGGVAALQALVVLDAHPGKRGDLLAPQNTTGRIAVITGASSRIGEATARALATAGNRVELLARRLDRIRALAEELGDGAVAIEADVTDRESIVTAAQRVEDELGGADILVNHAGVMLLGPLSTELSTGYRRMIETNLLGAITTTEVFLDQLIADGGGDLVNLSSVAGRTARAGNASTPRPSGG